MPIKDELLHKMQQLRRDVHQHPEVSGEEKETARRLKDFINSYEPDHIVEGLGGDGIAFVFKGSQAGPMVMIRGELDALPIEEINDVPYKSKYTGKGHQCGHDGHMTIVAGLAGLLAEKRPETGAVTLMFQPAEETGQGASRVLDDPKFADIHPDYIFALHNLPGFPENEVVVKSDIFASASKGVIISLKGKTSHAAEPENGKSPAMAVSEMINIIESAPKQTEGLNDFTLATTVHVKIGERAFGVTPGKAVVMATLRAYHDEDLAKLQKSVTGRCQQIADKFGLKMTFDETEIFYSTYNNTDCFNMIKDVADELKLSVTEVEHPFRWSEDFGLFTQKCKGAMFGLGAGKDTPDLHNPDYNFPEEIFESGVLMFYNIIDRLLNKNNA